MRRRVAGLLVVIAGLGVVAVPGAEAAKVKARAARNALPSFPSCPALLDYAQAGAHRTGGQPGVPPRAIPGPIAVLNTPAPMPAPSAGEATPVSAPTAAAPAAKDTSSTPFSTTNNQEANVDEPDLVKTDGKHIYAVSDRVLRVVDVTGAQPKLVGELKLDGFGQQLLLRGDTVLVIATQNGFAYPLDGPGGGGRPAIAIAPYPGRGKTIVSEISVADPAKPAVKRTMTIDGDFVDARQNGGTARLVIDSAPDQIQPQGGESVGKAIESTHTSDYLGGTTLKSNVSGNTYRRQLVHCNQVRHPRAFSGLDVLTIMTVDLDKGLYSLDRDGVMAGAQVVYGSTGSLYVASQRYYAQLEQPTVDGAAAQSVPNHVTTEIHRFDISDPDKTSYAASGVVDGFALNQYSLSEYKGDLRVATTEDPVWLATADGTFETGQRQSGVTVLHQDGGQLKTIGRLTGLGKDERIYAVRFIDDRAYIVTFRQIDPLFVVDLADPTAPKLRGQLNLTGYSAYLHPIGNDKLLGIGVEANAQGSVSGAQASLFDVSDPAKPARVSQLVFGPGGFQVATDPHAFLYWDPTKLAVLPLSTYGSNGPAFTGAVGLRVGGTLTEVGRITHDGADPDYKPAISRALVIGDKVFTLSYAGLGAARLDNLGPLGFTAFAPPAS
jgi:hypothetical protein